MPETKRPTGTWSTVEKRHASMSRGRYRAATSIRSAPSCTGVTGSDYCRQPTATKHSQAVRSYGCYRSGLPRKSPFSRCTRLGQVHAVAADADRCAAIDEVLSEFHRLGLAAPEQP